MMIPALSSITIGELKSTSARVKRDKPGAFDQFLAASVRELISERRTGAVVILAFIVMTGGLGWVIARAPVGQDNTFAIHNYLTRSCNRSNIYQMEKEITARFGGVYPMIVLVEAAHAHGKVLRAPQWFGASTHSPGICARYLISEEVHRGVARAHAGGHLPGQPRVPRAVGLGRAVGHQPVKRESVAACFSRSSQG